MRRLISSYSSAGMFTKLFVGKREEHSTVEIVHVEDFNRQTYIDVELGRQECAADVLVRQPDHKPARGFSLDLADYGITGFESLER